MKRILVVDSDEQVASILGVKLKNAGFAAETAGSSADALKIIPDFRPDIIVSEMILPKMSGIDFMKRVKMNPGMMRIPFVFLSSSRDVENKILALDMGAEAVFAKPLFINDFLKRIKEILGEYESKGAPESAENAPEGDISDISVLNILSILLENKSSGEVEFSSSSDKKGVIFCDCGNVVRAETEGGENRDGMEELYKILSWSDGTFSVNYGDVEVERNICLPQKKIIEKSITWFNEYSKILKSLPPLDTVVYLDFANFVENLNKLPEDIDFVVKNIAESGNRVSEIIDSCGGDRKLTAAYLKQLYELAVLSIENGQSSYEFPPVPDWMPSEKREEKVEITIETPEIIEEKENIADAGKKEETEKTEPEPVSAPVTESAGKPKKSAWDDFDAQAARRGKSGKISLFVLLLAIAAAIAIVTFIYWRGLI